MESGQSEITLPVALRNAEGSIAVSSIDAALQ
jgi:hypothetical protein